MNAALELPLAVGAALLASAEGYTPRANQLIEAARERLGTIQEVANALAENLPAPKSSRPLAPPPPAQEEGQAEAAAAQTADGRAAPAESRRAAGARRREQPRPKRRPRRRQAAGASAALPQRTDPAEADRRAAETDRLAPPTR